MPDLVRKPLCMVDFGPLLGAVKFRPKVTASDVDGVIHLAIGKKDFYLYLETKQTAFSSMSIGQRMLLDSYSRQERATVLEVVVSGKKTKVGALAFDPILFRQLGAEDWEETTPEQFYDWVSDWSEQCRREAMNVR